MSGEGGVTDDFWMLNIEAKQWKKVSQCICTWFSMECLFASVHNDVFFPLVFWVHDR